MIIDRRKFLKISAWSLAGIVPFRFASGYTLREIEAISNTPPQTSAGEQTFNMCNYAAPAIPVVRIGYIGLGSRGKEAVRRIVNIGQIEVKALCDLSEKQVKQCQQILFENRGYRATEYANDPDGWKKLCERQDLDLIYISTPWEWHVPMAVYAMQCGKHVALEVPAARTIEEAWHLVNTSEKTRRHCFQLENMVYHPFEMSVLNMVQSGLLGELIHGEGAYIHDVLKYTFGEPPRNGEKSSVWRYKEQLKSGNLYPTHGLGPVSMAMKINRGDRFDYMSSMSCNDFSLAPLAQELAKQNDYYRQFTKLKFRGNTNTSIIRTANGKTIMLQHDAASPRPYSRIYLLSGTKGFVQKYPLPGKIAFGHEFLPQQETDRLTTRYSPELIRHVQSFRQTLDGHGGADFVMDWRLIDCLRNGLPLDMDVYDAAAWSSVTPLSIWSCANRSNSIDFPDFTRGAWTTNRPVNMSLRGGGDTQIIGNPQSNQPDKN